MMKTIKISLLALFITVATEGISQSKYEKVMLQTLAMKDTAQSSETFMSLGNKFERIALAEKTEWLAYYWCAYSYTISSFSQTMESAEKDKVLDKAIAYIDSAENLEGDLDEIYLLKSFAYTGKLVVDPMSRGMKFGPLGAEQRAKALAINDKNPRYYYMEGINLVQTPAMWGGNKEKGKELLEKSVELYQTFEPKSDMHPNWGEEQAKGALKQLEKKEESTPEED